MGWKKLPAWLKGGIIFVLIPASLVALAWLNILLFNISPKARFTIIALSHLFAFWPGGIYAMLFHNLGDGIINEWIIPILISIVVYFLIGALIGFIIAKIKARRKV